jgi:uncharacterized protein YndB with AHSA1/START domain
MPHPPEKIWRALTQGALIEEWLMKSDFQPVVGHRFSFRATPTPHWNGVVDCEVLAVEPNERLAYTWSASGADAVVLKTVVTWTLRPTQKGALLRMEQSGFRRMTRSVIAARPMAGSGTSAVWSGYSAG